MHPDLPVVSLDEVRRDLGKAPGETDGAVITEARERARAYLRSRIPFAWDATNLAADLRGKPIDLALDYGARVRIAYVEAPAALLWKQNADRPYPVPEAAIRRMMDRWEGTHAQ